MAPSSPPGHTGNGGPSPLQPPGSRWDWVARGACSRLPQPHGCAPLPPPAPTAKAPSPACAARCASLSPLAQPAPASQTASALHTRDAAPSAPRPVAAPAHGSGHPAPLASTPAAASAAQLARPLADTPVVMSTTPAAPASGSPTLVLVAMAAWAVTAVRRRQVLCAWRRWVRSCRAHATDLAIGRAWRASPARQCAVLAAPVKLYGTAADAAGANRPCPSDDVPCPRVLDLFCGGGGASFGAEGADLQVAAGLDNAAHALDCFAHNSPHAVPLHLDLYDEASALTEVAKHGPFDVIPMGSPCQAFCHAGLRLTNVLLTFNGLRVAVGTRAPFILLENVPEIMTHNGGHTWLRCLRILHDSHYRTQHAVIDAAHWVPQRRRRVFLLATLRPVAFDLPRAAAELSDMPVQMLRQHFPHWQGCYYHPAVQRGRSLHTLDAPSPPLRTNCTRPSCGYLARTDDLPFDRAQR